MMSRLENQEPPRRELPWGLTADELAEAERRRVPYLYPVHARYEIVAGILRPTAEGDVRRHYLPIATPGVVGAAARLEPGDERHAIAFARRWGQLGYDQLAYLFYGQRLPSGDPLIWLWAHSRGIRVVLKLRRLLAKEEIGEIEEYLHGLRVSQQAAKAFFQANNLLREGRTGDTEKLLELMFGRSDDSDALANSPELIFGIRQSIGYYGWPWNPGDDARKVARRIILSIVNSNLGGVYRQLRDRSLDEGDPEIEYGYDSLLSVSYWHLAEIVAGGRTQECIECGTVFRQHDGRQQFCPRDPFSRESLCALKYRQRKQRHRKSGRRK